MANATQRVQVVTTDYVDNEKVLGNYAIPAASTTFFSGQLLGRDTSGNVTQLDDTAKKEFYGLCMDTQQNTVGTTDVVGDKKATVERPPLFQFSIAAAVAGDFGRKVYAAFNNAVSYSPGVNANLVGRVFRYIDSTTVEVAPPWSSMYMGEGYDGLFSVAAAAPTTLTQYHKNCVILCPLTSSEPITLPAASSIGTGDTLLFINTSSNSSVPTLTAAGSDTINGAATLAMSATQYTALELVSDGTSKWYVDVPGASLSTLTVTGTTTLGLIVETVTAVQDMSTAGTITLPTASSLKRLTASGGAATGVIMAAGATAGQVLTLVNADAANNITFAIAGTSNVADGTGTLVTHLCGITLVWDAVTSLWYHLK